ncbi:uncharacterized protein [Penaeus vannamei]|uniref:uncharacterized protein n=1 Tax=Penaeus vannamei TaxID=6689 RepID=UPI00387F8623
MICHQLQKTVFLFSTLMTQFLHAASVNNLNELIGKAKQTLTEAKQYFEINGLKLNPQKTQCIFIGSRQNIAKIPTDTMIEFQGCYIKPSTTVKNLGVYIDRYMTFETHIDHIYRKVMGTLIYLNHIKNKIPTETRIIVIQTLALSIINYCLNISGSTNKTQIQRTQKLQNFAARVALGNINKYDHITPHINTLKWLNVQQKYNYDTCILIHKIIQGIYPHWLLPIRTTGNTTGVQTRQNNCLYIKRSNTETGARNMLIRRLVTWNQLPENVRNISNQKTFKTKVKEHILKYQWHQAHKNQAQHDISITYGIIVMCNFVPQALYNIYVHSTLLHCVNTLYVKRIPIVINGIKYLNLNLNLNSLTHLHYSIRSRVWYR